MKIKELEQELSTRRARIRELEGELDVKRCAKMYTKELSDAHRFQIKFVIVEHFRASTDHHIKLSEYVVMAYIKCIGYMIKPMTKRGIEAAVPILVEAKKSYTPFASPFYTTRVELPKATSTTGDDQKVES